jgi:hypothetical protein
MTPPGAQSVHELLGEEHYQAYDVLPDTGLVFIPLLQLGDGLAGPENDQPLQILRDDRPLAVDELGKGHLGKLARHRAGRAMPLNMTWNAGVDQSMYERPPEQDARHPSGFGPGQNPAVHQGVPAPELVGNPRTILYTATPEVGWEGWA